jgi:guanylate kinase
VTVRRGLLIVISGPSGVGKDTLIQRLLKRDANLVKSVSFTTRPPRHGEVPGVDYVFTTRPEFEVARREGKLLESAEYDGHLYATSAPMVEQLRSAGRDTILKIDVQGAEQVRKLVPDALFIFIAPPSMEELGQRLKKRKTESEKDLAARREIAKTEMGYSPRYDYVVINVDVDKAADEVLRIIREARERQT